jgi:transcriptional regulator GlxA family with amidase domain
MAPFKVAVYLYEKADILDFSGPTEIYSYGSKDGTDTFEITSFAHNSPVKGATAALTYIPNATFADIAAKIEDFDILVIPGAALDTVRAMIKTNEAKELSTLLQKFISSKPRQESGKRILQSVCTGSILLAASGILAGRDCTTHHTGFDMLKEVADEAAGGDSKINVKKTRWVDAGTSESGVRIITAGGVSSGIDTSIFVVEQMFGKEMADWAAEISEFERRDKGWGEVH